MYVTYECRSCKITFSIPKLDLERMEATGREVRCNFGHRDIYIIDRYKVNEIDMKHDSYIRKRGRVVQKGWGK